MTDFQLIVIGAGPGGYMAALRAAKKGLRTAVIESREAGGTCLNRGCVPTKALLHSSQVYSDALSGAQMGVSAGEVSIDIEAMYAHKKQIVEKLSGGVESLLKAAKVEFIRGHGSICAPGEVRVCTAEGEEQTYTAQNILVATGSVPARPPIPGLELPGVVTSDELLDGDAKLHRSIVIIGGGVIGVEFATFYSDLGCRVSIVEGLDRLLPNMDRELGQNLAQLLKKKGVQIFTNAMVERVEQAEDGLRVCFSAKGAAGEATGDAVLCAIGRRPNTEGLFPGELQPEMDGRRIRVDASFGTSIPGVYAIGDVSSPVQLAHVATAQGENCVDMLCGESAGIDMNIVPGCIYCRPEIASVGLCEADAKAAGIPVKVGKCTLFSNARTLIADTGRSFMKVVAHAQTHAILGAQLMCDRCTDMITQISQAIAHGLTVEQMLRVMRPHPTYEEALTEALEDLLAKLSR
ncbi:MAG: dihydrolipoyl dehydrogenase [Eubacteriales bacterium]|nr:dihydrolipoyl dehydrogenase [Eubacteriales bacterium]